MAIVAVFEFPGEPIEKYEQVFEAGGTAIVEQPRRLQHLCYRTGDTGFVVVDVWEDEGAFADFGAVIGPAIHRAGLDAAPQVYPLHGRMEQGGGRNP
jgi:hypothetical protein